VGTTLETKDGALIYETYKGIWDLGESHYPLCGTAAIFEKISCKVSSDTVDTQAQLVVNESEANS
jgi:hypothetical protein